MWTSVPWLVAGIAGAAGQVVLDRGASAWASMTMRALAAWAAIAGGVAYAALPLIGAAACDLAVSYRISLPSYARPLLVASAAAVVVAVPAAVLAGVAAAGFSAASRSRRLLTVRAWSVLAAAIGLLAGVAAGVPLPHGVACAGPVIAGAAWSGMEIWSTRGLGFRDCRIRAAGWAWRLRALRKATRDAPIVAPWNADARADFPVPHAGS